MASTVWRGRLAFGMVSIPVRLYKAARRERVRFHHVYRPEGARAQEEPEEEAPEPPRLTRGKVQEFPKSAPPPEAEAPDEAAPDLVRVRNLPVNEADERPVQKTQVLKGYEIEKDRYVTFDPGEIAALRPPTSTELDIAEFVRLEEIDPVYFETSYYAAPDRGGERPYALLVQALTETGYAAIGSLAMHGREHATVIRPGQQGLIVHTLFYQNEVRSAEEYRSDPALVSSKELELAKTFVRALAAPFEPGKLKDTFEERLQALIHSRASEAVDAYQHGKAAAPAASPQVDILEALRKSIEMARKPPAREKGAEPKPRQRRSRS